MEWSFECSFIIVGIPSSSSEVVFNGVSNGLPIADLCLALASTRLLTGNLCDSMTRILKQWERSHGVSLRPPFQLFG